MRYFLIVLLLIAGHAGVACALTGGPDGGGYSFIDSNEPLGPAYAFEDIAEVTNTTGLAGTDRAVQIPLGFYFTFYGAVYNTVFISTNGHIDFQQGDGNEDYNPQNLPVKQPSNYGGATDNGWGVNPLMAVFFDDLDPLSGGDVYVDTRGSSPNRRFIVQWDNVPHFDCPSMAESANDLTFQAILYENTNEIGYQYRDVATAGLTPECAAITNGGSATVGLDFDDVVALEYSANAAVLSNGLGVLIYPGSAAVINPAPAALNFGDVQVGRGSSAIINLQNTGGQMLFISASSVAPATAQYSVVSDNCKGHEVLAGDYCTMTVVFHPTVAQPDLADTITIVSSDSLNPTIDISLLGNGVNLLSGVSDIELTDTVGIVNDLQAEFGSLPVFEEKSLDFTLSNAGPSALEVYGIGPVSPPYALAWDNCTGQSLASGSACDFSISFAAARPGLYRGTFEIASNDPYESPLAFVVNATAYYVLVANITVSDSTAPTGDLAVFYADTRINETVAESLTLGNNGTDDLEITGYTGIAAPFAINQPDPCMNAVLQYGKSCTLTVLYAPGEVGYFANTLGIVSTDLRHSPLNIALVANALSNPPDAPVLVYPGLAATGVPVDFEFLWERSTDPDGDAVSYELYYRDEADYLANGFAGAVPIPVAAASSNSVVMYASALSLPGLMMLVLAGQYVYGGRGRRLVALILILSALVVGLLACGNGLAVDGDGASGGGGQVRYSVTGLSAGASYYWQVTAVDSHGERMDSVIWSFTTAPQ